MQHIGYRVEPIPWNYWNKVRDFLKEDTKLLVLGLSVKDIFFQFGKHPFPLISVAQMPDQKDQEDFSCLDAYGFTVKPVETIRVLPFQDECFDLVIHMNSPYDLNEIRRVLKPGGHFITQQVGGEDHRILLESIMRQYFSPCPEENLENILPRFLKLGFKVVYRNQCYPKEIFETVDAIHNYIDYHAREFPLVLRQNHCKEFISAAEIVSPGKGFSSIRHFLFLVVKKR